MNTGNGVENKTDKETVECNTFFMLPMNIEVAHDKDVTQEHIQAALMDLIKQELPKVAPQHLPEHVVIRSTYSYGGVDYVLKMLGNGSILPDAAPKPKSRIITP